MKDKVTVMNKSAGRVVYRIPEDGVRREFMPHEKKVLNVSELEKLVQQPGGPKLLYNFLMVQDREVIRYLVNGEVAPEYWLTEEKIPSWMNSCSLDEFKDALDFAPEGTKDLIKKIAVEQKLNDYSKRQAILDQLGFDVSRAIDNQEESEEPTAAAPVKHARRVPLKIEEPSEEVPEETAPARRVTI